MQSKEDLHLIFVYNAKSGWFNSLLDSAHKALSPSTYPCKLCELTHDLKGQRDEWIRFRESVNSTNTVLEFLHKDEFEKVYWSKWLPKFEYPLVLKRTNQEQGYNDLPTDNSGFDILISNEELNSLESTNDLIQRLNTIIQDA